MTTETHNCEGTVYGGIPTEYPCSRKGRHYEDGKWWCGMHAPSKLAAKRAAVSAKYRAERDADEALRVAAEERAKQLAKWLGANVRAKPLYVNGRVLGFDMVLDEHYLRAPT